MLLRAADEVVEFATAEILRNAPRDEGRLHEAVEAWKVVKGDGVVQVIAQINPDKAPHAVFVERGTGVFGKHGTPIVPTKATHMTFFWKKQGRWMRMTSVQGQPGQHYFKKSADNIEAFAKTKFKHVVRL